MINYIKKEYNYKIYISQDNSLIERDISIQRLMNNLLKKQLVNLATREKITKKQLGFKSKIPIYVNDQILFLCIKSYRSENSFYINYFSIISYDLKKDYILISFVNKHCLKLKEKYTFLNQLKKCRRIIDFINS